MKQGGLKWRPHSWWPEVSGSAERSGTSQSRAKHLLFRRGSPASSDEGHVRRLQPRVLKHCPHTPPAAQRSDGPPRAPFPVINSMGRLSRLAVVVVAAMGKALAHEPQQIDLVRQMLRSDGTISTLDTASTVESFHRVYGVAKSELGVLLSEASDGAPKRVHFEADRKTRVHVAPSALVKPGLGLWSSHKFDAGDLVDVEELDSFWSLTAPPKPVPFTTDCCGSGMLAAEHHADAIETVKGTAWELSASMQTFANHNSDPTCSVLPLVIHGIPEPNECPIVTGGRYAIFAITAIAKDTELTLDYGHDDMGSVDTSMWD